MRFVNRQDELSFLEKVNSNGGFQFVPIYGRRRIGKTRLIQEFIKDKKAIYFLADSVSEGEQLKNLGRIVGEYFNDSILISAGFKDWYQFFTYIKEKPSSRLILVIDEFPYLVNSNPAISSIFQKGIDEHLKQSNVFLILMSSSIGMMEKEVLFYKAPLYGRRTASLEVKEMTFDSLKEFFPDRAFENLVKIYSVLGTIPAYIEKINQRHDIFRNIKDLILDKGTFLYNEVEYILREELREPRNYFVILKAIAQGKRKLSEIINETGFEKSLVARYLDILKSLRFVEKDVPVTERYPEKSKQGLYKLHDKFFTFWFKYVFPNRNRLEIGNQNYVLKLIKDTFEHHVSTAYEDVCTDMCRDLMKKGLIQFTSIGKWWSKNEEIDIVALDDETKTAFFGECKWSNKKVGDDIYKDLVRKSQLVDWHNGKRKDRFILFSKNGFTQGMKEISKKEDVLLIQKDRVIK
ncbi:MAG: ATP-binding protein [Nitrospirota bacterium]